jgi:hypothetical protein
LIMANRRLEGRNGEIWHRYTVRSQTMEQIGEDLKLSNQRVSQIIADVQKSIGPIDREKMIQESIELVKYVKNVSIDLIEMAGAPVYVGKDGSIAYDENGNVVRDYSGRIAASKLALDADNVIAKRLGLDAATKTEVTGNMRVEIVGVDMEDLS